jgi:hypothetical protein
MKVTYAYLHIEILADEEIVNGPDELQLSDDVSYVEEDLEAWLSHLDEYPDLTFKLSIG